MEVVRDLGILLDKMLLRDHIDYVTAKAFKNLGFIFQTGQYLRNPHFMNILYCTYVHSILGYAVLI